MMDYSSGNAGGIYVLQRSGLDYIATRLGIWLTTLQDAALVGQDPAFMRRADEYRGHDRDRSDRANYMALRLTN